MAGNSQKFARIKLGIKLISDSVTLLGFALLHEPKGSGGDPECIFFTLNTYRATSISDIL